MNAQLYLPQTPLLPRFDPRTGTIIPAPVRRRRLLSRTPPSIPAEWMAGPSTTPQPSPCDVRPLFVPAGAVPLSLVIGGVIGWMLGRIMQD